MFSKRSFVTHSGPHEPARDGEICLFMFTATGATVTVNYRHYIRVLEIFLHIQMVSHWTCAIWAHTDTELKRGLLKSPRLIYDLPRAHETGD